MINIWFNHWFSTAYNIIELMRAGDSELNIICTNKCRYTVIGNVCDELCDEPDIGGAAYIDFCLGFCKEQRVDVFVPRRQLTEISRSKERFEDLGVKVMAEREDIACLLADKRGTYRLFEDCPGVNVPEYRIVNDPESFEKGYRELSEQYQSVCMKFVNDEGALSFRRIVPERRLDLGMYVKAEVSYPELVAYFSEHTMTDDIMLMPFLSGNEISVDCLDTHKGLIAVPRVKSYSRHEFVRYDDDITEAVKAVSEKIKLEYPYNIQFRLSDGKPYLLEVNTRMSGGIQMSALASGVNIPRLALLKLLGREFDFTLDKTPCTVSYIERPRIIGGKDR